MGSEVRGGEGGITNLIVMGQKVWWMVVGVCYSLNNSALSGFFTEQSGSASGASSRFCWRG